MIATRSHRTLVRDFGWTLAGAGFTALAAQVSIPAVPVPFTLQTLAVTVCGLTLGARRGAASQVAYLFAGACGLPVFAEGKAGVGWLFGLTGGYLWSFILAARLLGWMADRGLTRKAWSLIGGLVGANALILFLGAAWLSLAIGVEKAWTAGVVPFLSGAVIKSIAAVVVARCLPSPLPDREG